MRCQCPKTSADHAAGLCLNTATTTVRRGRTAPVALHLCRDCTLSGDVHLCGEEAWA